MGAVVDGQSDGNDDVDNSYTVQLDLPEGEESEEEHVDEGDAEEDQEGDGDASGEDDDDEEDGDEGEDHVEGSLLLEDHITLVVVVPLAVGEGLLESEVLLDIPNVLQQLHALLGGRGDEHRVDALSEAHEVGLVIIVQHVVGVSGSRSSQVFVKAGHVQVTDYDLLDSVPSSNAASGAAGSHSLGVGGEALVPGAEGVRGDPLLFAAGALQQLLVEVDDFLLGFGGGVVEGVAVHVEGDGVSRPEVLLLAAEVVHDVGVLRNEVGVLEVDVDVGEADAADGEVDDPDGEDDDSAPLGGRPLGELLVEQSLSSVRELAVVIVDHHVGLLSLEGEALLLGGEAGAFAADHGLLRAAAEAAAVTLLAHLPAEVPHHEGGVDGDAGEVEHEHAQASEEAEAAEGLEGGGAAEEEGDGVGERGDGDGGAGALHAFLDPVFHRVSRVGLVQRRRNDKHVVGADSDQKEWKDTVDSSRLGSQVVGQA
mmetsp:Transcript_18041/g.30749  ORF Transcript_18041/g.30749 Transcript_18041/m.30749 type:complete len:481 (-) Transcript_18041:1026-2468(-)